MVQYNCMYHYALEDYAQKDIADRMFVLRTHAATDVGGELSPLDARATSKDDDPQAGRGSRR